MSGAVDGCLKLAIGGGGLQAAAAHMSKQITQTSVSVKSIKAEGGNTDPLLLSTDERALNAWVISCRDKPYVVNYTMTRLNALVPDNATAVKLRNALDIYCGVTEPAPAAPATFDAYIVANRSALVTVSDFTGNFTGKEETVKQIVAGCWHTTTTTGQEFVDKLRTALNEQLKNDWNPVCYLPGYTAFRLPAAAKRWFRFCVGEFKGIAFDTS
eukprot:TRINITY_DN6831_c0_g1_i2.p1 TRINITY_DN6831_c0_g1~~TRINITY_DN6831_c0_g1_i2.p1  ORF type:complete len:213 (+),score=23.42 TRINITY_DN6831_c0_g1_i2:570-1208(+)